MSITGITGTLPPFVSAQPTQRPSSVGGGEGTDFSQRLNGAVKDLADSQAKASDSAKSFEMGTETDLASVMIDQQVSSLGFQMALNVRNKALTAYRDIMNMPV